MREENEGESEVSSLTCSTDTEAFIIMHNQREIEYAFFFLFERVN